MIAPVFAPMGFGGLEGFHSPDHGIYGKRECGFTLSGSFGSTETLLSVIAPLSAVSLLVFCLLYTPCVAAVASIKRELGGKWGLPAWLWGQCVIAWIAAVGGIPDRKSVLN